MRQIEFFKRMYYVIFDYDEIQNFVFLNGNTEK